MSVGSNSTYGVSPSTSSANRVDAVRKQVKYILTTYKAQLQTGSCKKIGWYETDRLTQCHVYIHSSALCFVLHIPACAGLL